MLQKCWTICGALTRSARSLSSGSPVPCFLAGRDISVGVYLGIGCVDIRERGVDAGSMIVSLAAQLSAPFDLDARTLQQLTLLVQMQGYITIQSTAVGRDTMVVKHAQLGESGPGTTGEIGDGLPVEY